MSLGFMVCFGIIVIRRRTVKGLRGALFYMGPRFKAILCVIVGKINNMMLCVKILLIYTCLTF